MRSAQIAVLAIALLAGGTAAFMIARTPEPATAPPVVVEKAVAVDTVDVLVARGDLATGQTLKAPDLRWQPWPVNIVPAGSITKATDPAASEESVGSIVRSSFLTGEPIRKEKLIKADGGGYMSAILGPGRRAIAISIDTRGATSAGGFILPNDHVDVLRTFRDEDQGRGGESQSAETLLTNIRVLAIGQNVQERNGEKVVAGETATLEVTPSQAETLALAQKVGQLALILRSLADSNAKAADTPAEAKEEAGLTVVRYGVKQTLKR